MRTVLQEEWDRITIEEINALFRQLPLPCNAVLLLLGAMIFILSSFSVNFS